MGGAEEEKEERKSKSEGRQKVVVGRIERSFFGATYLPGYRIEALSEREEIVSTLMYLIKLVKVQYLTYLII